MSLSSILILIVGLGGAILGALLGHPFSKSSGRKEGAQQATDEQQVTQAKAITEAVQERNNVETNVAAAPRTDIDRELSEFSRPD
jgi:flagellar basal body-associated protein FliL